jgi:hypothetical protein
MCLLPRRLARSKGRGRLRLSLQEPQAREQVYTLREPQVPEREVLLKKAA